MFENYTCLSDTDPAHSCATCWKQQPCDVCHTGSCSHCQSCLHDKTGDCASCHIKDSANFTCILPYHGLDCKGCWSVDEGATPFVIFSGLTASVLNATWTGIPLCKDQPTPTTVWPFQPGATIEELLCNLEVLQVTFDEATKTFKDRKGVKISIVDFGGLDGLTFGTAFASAMEQYGYRVGVNLFGAPFDWRLGSQSDGPLYRNLTDLIETVFAKNGGKKVALVAPSFGPQVALGFLHQQTQEWKDKYISWFVADSPVWSGAPEALCALTSGFPLFGNKTGIQSRLVRGLAQALPSLFWLTPEPGNDAYTYNATESLVTTPSKNYSAGDIPSLLHDIGANKHIPVLSYMKGSSSLNSLNPFNPPLVNTYVIYGYNVPTPSRFIYDKDFSRFGLPSVTPGVAHASGDGIVALRSGRRSLLWEEKQKLAGKTLIHGAFEGLPHAECILFNGAGACFDGFVALLVNGTVPPARDLPPLN